MVRLISFYVFYFFKYGVRFSSWNLLKCGSFVLFTSLADVLYILNLFHLFYIQHQLSIFCCSSMTFTCILYFKVFNISFSDIPKAKLFSCLFVFYCSTLQPRFPTIISCFSFSYVYLFQTLEVIGFFTKF